MVIKPKCALITIGLRTGTSSVTHASWVDILMSFKKLIWISTGNREKIIVGKPFIIPWLHYKTGAGTIGGRGHGIINGFPTMISFPHDF
jgi:hypothetical protein